MAATATAASEWSDSEVTGPDYVAPPRRARPVHAAELAPAVRRVAIWLLSGLGGWIVFLVVMGWMFS